MSSYRSLAAFASLALTLGVACSDASDPSPDLGGASPTSNDTGNGTDGNGSGGTGTGSGSGSGSGSGGTPTPGPTPDGGAPAAHDAGSPDAAPSIPTRPGWKLTWNDEFNGADGTAIDGSKWATETGNSGWSNNKERQFYTPGTENAEQRGGSLVITARTDNASKYSCQYGACMATSARFNSAGKFDQKYGRFEARIQIPRGQGMWPAWWMLGNNIGSAGWPSCGEIDIMENVGYDPASDHGSLHGPGYSGGNPLTGATALPGGAPLADAFHVYAVEWEANVVRFYLDDALFETRTPADVPGNNVWVYDHAFYLILNLAVGGQWPGDPDSTTQYPQTMKVDYVRVYSR